MQTGEHHTALLKKLTDSALPITYSLDYKKAAQIVSPDQNHNNYRIRIIDFVTEKTHEIILKNFTDSSSDIVIAWDKLPNLFWIKQNNNAYIIFTDTRKPIFLPNTQTICFSSKGNYAICNPLKQHNSRLLCLKTNQFLLTEKLVDTVDLCISGNEQYVCAEYFDQNAKLAKLYNIANNSCIFEYDNVYIAKFSKNSTLLYLQQLSDLIIFDIEKLSHVSIKIDTNISIPQSRISPDGGYFILENKNNLTLVDRNGTFHPEYKLFNDNWLPNHPHALAVYTDKENQIAIIDVENGNNVFNLEHFFQRNIGAINKIEYSNTGKYLIIKPTDGYSIYIISVDGFTGEENSTSMPWWSFDDKFFTTEERNGCFTIQSHQGKIPRKLLTLKLGTRFGGFEKNSNIIKIYNSDKGTTIYHLDYLELLEDRLINDPHLHTIISKLEHMDAQDIKYLLSPEEEKIVNHGIIGHLIKQMYTKSIADHFIQQVYHKPIAKKSITKELLHRLSKLNRFKKL